MLNRDVEMELKNAVEKLTPNILDSILEKCEERESNTFIINQRKPRRNWPRGLSSAAAVLLIMFCGWFAFEQAAAGRVDMLVMLDVNPSIEIEVNPKERVVGVKAKNEDAVKILDNMDLKNTQINVAVNALIGSMLKYGYINESANSVLISVDGDDLGRNTAMQKNLSASIGQQLSVINGAVISQTLAANPETQQQAADAQISYGKAALVQRIIDENSHLLFADLAALSVNELNLLAGSKSLTSEGLEYNGIASDKEFIGEEKAAQTAFSHAGINGSEAGEVHIELDYDDGIMVYDVDFKNGGYEYEYEINAKDGLVIEYDREITDGSHHTEQKNTVQDDKDFIGEEKALEIAENHSGITNHTVLEIELDKDDGLYIYEVEFKVGETEYDFDINATTGEIISYEIED